MLKDLKMEFDVEKTKLHHQFETEKGELQNQINRERKAYEEKLDAVEEEKRELQIQIDSERKQNVENIDAVKKEMQRQFDLEKKELLEAENIRQLYLGADKAEEFTIFPIL